MAIYRLLQNSTFEPARVAVMTAVFEELCRELGLVQRDDPLTNAVATAIIACAQKGERDPIRLRECAHDLLKA
jgi:hypothetical protein